MTNTRLSVASVVLAVAFVTGTAAGVLAQKYGVTATADKNTDFSKFKTYGWTPGRGSLDKTNDARIIAAVDRELAGVGLTRAASSAADVHVAYYSVNRTDVDVKAKPDEKGLRPQNTVGTLVVAMLEPAGHKELLRLRIDKPIDTEPARVEAEINAAVTEMFAKYPTRTAKK